MIPHDTLKQWREEAERNKTSYLYSSEYGWKDSERILILISRVEELEKSIHIPRYELVTRITELEAALKFYADLGYIQGQMFYEKKMSDQEYLNQPLGKRARDALNGKSE